jgi:hypothetical protein
MAASKSKVLPYQFEPLQGKGNDEDSHQDDSENEEDLSRKDTIEW